MGFLTRLILKSPESSISPRTRVIKFHVNHICAVKQNPILIVFQAMSTFRIFRYSWDGRQDSTHTTLREIKSFTDPAFAEPAGLQRVESFTQNINDEPRLIRRYEMGNYLKAKDKAKRRKALWKRFLMVLTIGVALIGPMLIMVFRLHPGKIAALATTSGAIFLFSWFVASWLSLFSKNWEDTEQLVLLTSAIYAAVLVVFVGASLS